MGIHLRNLLNEHQQDENLDEFRVRPASVERPVPSVLTQALARRTAARAEIPAEDLGEGYESALSFGANEPVPLSSDEEEEDDLQNNV